MQLRAAHHPLLASGTLGTKGGFSGAFYCQSQPRTQGDRQPHSWCRFRTSARVQHIPGQADLGLGGAHLADGSRDVAAGQHRMGDEDLAGSVDPVQQCPVAVVVSRRLGSTRARSGAARTPPSPARRRPSPRTSPPARRRGGCAPASRSAAVAAQHRPQLQRGGSAGPAPGRTRCSDSASSASGVRRNSGTRLNAARRAAGRPRPQQRAVHRGRAATCAGDHQRIGALRRLEGPAELRADHGRAARVGGIHVQPACRRASHASAIAGTGSTDVVAVVPTVATTTAVALQVAERRRAAGTRRRWRPCAARMPSIRAPFSTAEWVCSEQTTSLRPVVSRCGDHHRHRPGRGGVLDVAVRAVGQVEQLQGASCSTTPSSSVGGGRGAPEKADRVERRRQ